MSVLICGGAGYIGSHAVRRFVANGEDVIVVDNLETGHREALDPGVKFYEGDIRNAAVLDKIFEENEIDAVIHFAAYSLVGESVARPLKYFNNNVGGMQSLLEAMVRHNVDKIVFSSTAAVYGEPKKVPIEENDPTQPTNPYGETKLAMEKMMRWVDGADGIRFVSLRYFNAAGAMPDGSIGEAHMHETHLIPLILQVPLGKREAITIFGTDYPTKDGTCIRDYIHVLDLADAHLRALSYLRAGGSSDIFNLGSGTGFSVKEMIAAAEKVTGQSINVKLGNRRLGDPAVLIASSAKARRELGWKPKFDDVEKIIADAWTWHCAHPNGYVGLKVGLKNTVEGRSTEETSAVAMGSGSLNVLSTPSMLALMERAANELVNRHLPLEQTSVGTSLNVEHKAATPIGLTFRAEAELIAIDGRKLTFKVRAFDEREEIGSGTHERFIVNRKKFQSKADDKR